jgi:uncharacterized protein (DUF2062 family)
MMNPVSWLRTKSGELVRLKDTPSSLAKGVAVGMFFSFVPLVGLKTLLALGLTRLFRGNLLAAVITVTLHDVLLPVAPILLRWEYDLGYWLLSHPHGLPPHLQIEHEGIAALLHWSTFLTIGRPLLVGSLVFALPAALLAYYLMLRWAEHRENRIRGARQKETPGEPSAPS